MYGWCFAPLCAPTIAENGFWMRMDDRSWWMSNGTDQAKARIDTTRQHAVSPWSSVYTSSCLGLGRCWSVVHWRERQPGCVCGCGWIQADHQQSIAFIRTCRYDVVCAHRTRTTNWPKPSSPSKRYYISALPLHSASMDAQFLFSWYTCLIRRRCENVASGFCLAMPPIPRKMGKIPLSKGRHSITAFPFVHSLWAVRCASADTVLQQNRIPPPVIYYATACTR